MEPVVFQCRAHAAGEPGKVGNVPDIWSGRRAHAAGEPGVVYVDKIWGGTSRPCGRGAGERDLSEI